VAERIRVRAAASASIAQPVFDNSLFAGLGAGAIASLLKAAVPVQFAAGEQLVRQGQRADGAYIVETGHAVVVTNLPGGGDTIVAELLAGSVLGEMALLDQGVRSATVVARAPLTGRFIERDAFRLLLAQREPAAFAVRGRIMRTLCLRLRELNARIAAADSQGGGVEERAVRGRSVSAAKRRRVAFDWRAFLPLLPAFHGFSRGEIDTLCRRARCVQVERGRSLFVAGDPGRSVFVVVRGALQIAGEANDHQRRIGILGPGRFCGILALIEGHAHSMSALAREHATLLEISKAQFDRLFSGCDAIAPKFQDALIRELLQSLARANNQLTRLVSQARIRDHRGRRLRAEALTREFASLDYRRA
jgi:cAMP-dependent protein kinase regulator